MASEDKNSSGRHLVTIGVFIPGDCQVLDLAPVDIMGNMAHECTYTASLCSNSLSPHASPHTRLGKADVEI
ncbi:hypothetical protein GGR54DRAFT_642195 [Hypoxylon sp. NC1633]|nr:hypothetical protein GGR54DRAFT_642195 [Hypoxylon sp. NC1633]